LNEAALLRDLGPRPWDTEASLSMTSSLGKFSHTLLGYDSAPALAQIAIYWSYLLATLVAYLFVPVPAGRPAVVGAAHPVSAAARSD
jgi:hypothetical protein